MSRDRIWINPEHDCAELRALVRQAHPDAQIMGKAPPAAFPSEPTAIGDQLLIPGCERRETHGTKPAQPDLWDAANMAGR